MRGLGTIINVGLLILGGICGLLFGKRLGDRVKDTLMSVNGVAVMMLAIGGVIGNMMSVSDGKLMESLIPDSGLVVLSGAGHFSYLDKPGDYAVIVRKFLEPEMKK